MRRIEPVEPEAATPEQAEALDAFKRAWGVTPNLARVIAQSGALTNAFLSFGAELGRGAIPAALGEQIAIAVAEENRCSYCLAAHTAAATAYGVPTQDVRDARVARASDAKTEAALQFVQAVVRERGHVSDASLAAVRDAGWDDSAIVELVGHAASNTLTNYLHHVSAVPVDFPQVGFAS